jgi:hypothetical protein
LLGILDRFHAMSLKGMAGTMTRKLETTYMAAG